MTQTPCPKCGADIDSDSIYCDQCGAAMIKCPECGKFLKGKFCSACGKPGVTPGQPHAPAQPDPTGQTSQTGPTGPTSPTNPTRPTAQATTYPDNPVARPTTNPYAVQMPTQLVCSQYGISIPLQSGAVIGRVYGPFAPQLGGLRSLSGNHARTDMGASGWTITDIGSSYGTTVNGTLCQRNMPVPIQRGDDICFATMYHFIVQ